jgi:hypothetical protein
MIVVSELRSLLFSLLYSILVDEHTRSTTVSYAIGVASGKEGTKAGLCFSATWGLLRMLLLEGAYLALPGFRP